MAARRRAPPQHGTEMSRRQRPRSSWPCLLPIRVRDRHSPRELAPERPSQRDVRCPPPDTRIPAADRYGHRGDETLDRSRAWWPRGIGDLPSPVRVWAQRAIRTLTGHGARLPRPEGLLGAIDATSSWVKATPVPAPGDPSRLDVMVPPSEAGVATGRSVPRSRRRPQRSRPTRPHRGMSMNGA